MICLELCREIEFEISTQIWCILGNFVIAQLKDEAQIYSGITVSTSFSFYNKQLFVRDWLLHTTTSSLHAPNMFVCVFSVFQSGLKITSKMRKFKRESLKKPFCIKISTLFAICVFGRYWFDEFFRKKGNKWIKSEQKW